MARISAKFNVSNSEAENNKFQNINIIFYGVIARMRRKHKTKKENKHAWLTAHLSALNS